MIITALGFGSCAQISEIRQKTDYGTIVRNLAILLVLEKPLSEKNRPWQHTRSWLLFIDAIPCHLDHLDSLADLEDEPSLRAALCPSSVKHFPCTPSCGSSMAASSWYCLDLNARSTAVFVEALPIPDAPKS
ncbi:hypothetical protein VTH06DRAFT_530 [Thermothelomyces fergusii]